MIYSNLALVKKVWFVMFKIFLANKDKEAYIFLSSLFNVMSGLGCIPTTGCEVYFLTVLYMVRSMILVPATGKGLLAA